MHDNANELIRAAMAHRPPPQLTEDFTANVMKAVRARERARPKPVSGWRRVMLRASWLAVVSGSAALVVYLPWAAQIPPALSGLWDWIVLISIALMLWHAPLIKWLSICCERLLPFCPQADFRKGSTRREQ